MRDAAPLFAPLGVKLKIVGNGTPDQAKAFAEKNLMVDQVYTDPERHVYRALGMVSDKGASLSFDIVKNGLRAFTQGHRQGRTQGDPWQQGGTVVITRDGTILYRYLSQTGGDHAPLPSVIAAITTALSQAKDKAASS